MTISIYFGNPGDGKSFCVTALVSQLLLDKKNTKKIFTNYPVVVTKKPSFFQKIKNILKIRVKLNKFKLQIIKPEPLKDIKYSSYKWIDDESYIESVHDALICIDESHEKYAAAYSYELTKEDRKFISKHRHNGLDIIVMSQSYEDVHVFLRRRTNFFVHVTKIHHFWKKLPSYFRCDTYLSKADFLARNSDKKHKLATRYSTKKIKFNKTVGNAYNTHYYRDLRPEPEFEKWDECNNE